ncbi:MAG: hypothetical protein L6R42_007524 [Xanthoria sp. 1 TBL-2021]|nr:MAG: hypothetical protein L6R42_007524 [Xanthoria sp. 1 TBL-2021]
MAKDPDMPTPEEVNAIKEFIDGQVDTDTAAKQCTSRISLEEKSPDPTLIWSFLASLAVEFFDTQDKVVELLAAIKRLPNPIRDGKEHKIYSERTFSDLGYFRADFGDYFRGLKFADPASFHYGSKVPVLISWARVNALSARLTTNLVQDFRRYALDTIEDALDEKYLKESRTREFFLPAAANQIIFASYPLWNLRNDSEVEGRMDAVLEWNRWKTAFEGLAEDTEVSRETRAILRQAVAAMETVAQDPERDEWQGKLVQYQASLRAARES